jgi:hypothetical protein
VLRWKPLVGTAWSHANPPNPKGGPCQPITISMSRIFVALSLAKRGTALEGGPDTFGETWPPGCTCWCTSALKCMCSDVGTRFMAVINNISCQCLFCFLLVRVCANDVCWFSQTNKIGIRQEAPNRTRRLEPQCIVHHSYCTSAPVSNKHIMFHIFLQRCVRNYTCRPFGFVEDAP